MLSQTNVSLTKRLGTYFEGTKFCSMIAQQKLKALSLFG
jgi:hypothetical protein